MFFLDAGDKFFITLWRSCDAGDKFSITLWRSCDAEFITLSAEQRRDKVNYHPPSLTNKLGNNGSSHIIRKHNHPNVLQDVTFNNSQVLRSFLAKRKRPRQAPPTNMGKYFHLFLLHGNAFRWMKPPMSLDNFLYKKYLESNGLMPFAG